jgi:uncharacterized membrane protein
VVNIAFCGLLKAPTPAGRRLLDQIEGFKLYLEVAEKERLGILNPPEKTPELFEKYLPYALALNVENEWNEQFAEVLEKAAQDPEGYSPDWYHGRSYRDFSGRSFAETFSQGMAAAISSASTPPGSVSGSSGGGFSGGGAGGGGGSGW